MADETELGSLNSVKYLYLRRLTEPRDNSLRVLVQEAISNPPLPESAGKVVHISRIESTDSCRTFELVWKRYVAYLVTEEVVGSCRHEDEIYTGDLFRVYTKSHFLEYMARNTGGHWRLARAVSHLGQLGVVSGTALDQILARRLQDGDPGGHMRLGLDRFPFRKMAERIWETYFIPGGKTESQSYKNLPKLSKDSPRELIELCIVAIIEVSLAREGRIDGFVVEGCTAGGHNAPPRGKLQLNEAGEPIYGERDTVDLEKLRELGLPFWLAGGYGSAEKLREALAAGATGVQVGTAFAFCEESGLRDDYKRTLLQKAISGEAKVFHSSFGFTDRVPF